MYEHFYKRQREGSEKQTNKQTKHLYHYLACGVTGLRHKRHDALAKLIANLAEQLVSAETSTSSHLEATGSTRSHGRGLCAAP